MFCDPIGIDESITLTLIILLKELFDSKLEWDSAVKETQLKHENLLKRIQKR